MIAKALVRNPNSQTIDIVLSRKFIDILSYYQKCNFDLKEYYERFILKFKNKGERNSFLQKLRIDTDQYLFYNIYTVKDLEEIKKNYRAYSESFYEYSYEFNRGEFELKSVKERRGKKRVD